MKQKNLLLIAVVLFSAVVMAGVQGMTSSYELQGVNDLSINQRRSDANGDAVNCELRWDVDAENVYRKSVSDNSVELVSTNLSWVGLADPILKQTTVTATSEFVFTQLETGEDAYVDFIVTPSNGYAFTPSGISFKVSRFGTNGPTIDVLWLKQDGTSQTLLSGVAPNRDKPSSSNVQEEIDSNEDYLVVTLNSEDLAAITTYSGIGRMRVVFNNLSYDKRIGFADVKITGVLQGNEGEEEVNPLMAIVTRADMPVSFTNDETYPWTISEAIAKNGNCGVKYSSSTLTMNYTSTYKTELTFEWLCRNYSNHSLSLFVDGVQTNSTTSNSYNTVRFYVEPGQHIIVFKDSIGGNSTSTNNYSYIKNIIVKEILPLESVVLTEKSQPLTFTNSGTWPWTIEDGYIQNTNYDNAYSGSKFSTSFTIDKTSKLSFNSNVIAYDGSNYTTDTYCSSGYHYFKVLVNGQQYMGTSVGSGKTFIALEPGEYTVEWIDTIYNKYYSDYKYYSQVSNVELSNNWIEVDLATAGTLGYEVLYSGKAEVLTDVEFLKISGPMNAADWTDIKNMTNLLALDLSEAQITEIPNNAFDGKSRINSVILPEGITRIGEYAFRGTSIRRINIPSTVKTIQNQAFYQCSQLQSIDFNGNSTLTTIGVSAFKDCSSLKEFIFPQTVTGTGFSVFHGCSSLRKLHFSDAMTFVDDRVCYGCSSLNDLHLPQNLQGIGYQTFYNTSSLRHIDFPNTLNTIYVQGFYNCGVDSVKLPVQFQNLANSVFSNCKNLKYIELPSYLNSSNYSYYYRFYDNGNRYANGYTTTGYFGYRNNFSNCPAIEKVVMRSATPPAIDSDPFSDARAKSDITLVVPSFAVVSYKLDTYWYQFGNIIEGDDVDYWKITSPLMLTNNRRMQGKPDVDLYYGGQLTVGGNAPFPMGQFNMFINESNPGRLLNTCENMSADQAMTKFSVDANKWYFFTPLHDVNVADILVSNNASYVFRYYDAQNRATNGASGSWKNVDTDKLYAGQGYIFHCNTACTITFPADADGQTQLFRTDDVSRTLTVNEASTTANRSWNYVGNPYPAYFDIYYMDFTAPITVWTGSTYKAYSVADDEFVLRPMQSFFVQKPDAVDAIVFHKEGRQLTTDIVHGASAAPARAAAANNRYVFNIAIENGELQDETRVVINDEALLGYEVERDAAKFMSMETSVPQLLTLDNEDNSYAINERPMANGQVRLAYYAGVEGFYTIRALRADGEVQLYDTMLDKTVDITTEDYTFQSDVTDGVNSSRFMLIFNIAGTTSIKNKVNTVDTTSSPVYNLAGQRVAKPAKGLYIQNGKKIVRK